MNATDRAARRWTFLGRMATSCWILAPWTIGRTFGGWRPGSHRRS